MSGAERGDLTRERERGTQRVVVDVLHEPEMQRLLGVDRSAREEEVAGRALPDELGEAPDVARAEVDAELAARDREPGAQRGRAHIARDRELHSRADGGTVDRGDDRRRVVHDRVEDLLERGPEGIGGRVAVPRRTG